MCTVTYIPTKNGYFLTSNRDESALRQAAIPPKKYITKGSQLFYPKDPVAGGTWIVADEKNYTLCLLNGGFVAHTKKPIYKRSRGMVLLDFFNYTSLEDFINNYDFNGLEPFTLIVTKLLPHQCLYELRWDEVTLHIKELDGSKGQIWSSCTLYDATIRQKRENWFETFLNVHKTITEKDILNFHMYTGAGDDENGLIIKRAHAMQTVCITSINCDNNRTKIYYNDLRNKKEYRFRIIQMALQN